MSQTPSANDPNEKELYEPDKIRITLHGGAYEDRQKLGAVIAHQLHSYGMTAVGVVDPQHGVRVPYEELVQKEPASLWDAVVAQRPHLNKVPVTVHVLQPGEQPRQPTYYDEDGTVRFQSNKIISGLTDRRVIDLNEVARTHYDHPQDRRQLAQLINYSVDGYNELSYSEIGRYTHEAAERLRAKLGRVPNAEEEEANWDAELGVAGHFE